MVKKSNCDIHQCALLEEEGILVNYINTGCCIYTRRHFRKLFMINKSHPEAKKIFRSKATITREQIRHLMHYYIMIHPFSMGRMYWELLMAFIFSCQAFVTPFSLDLRHTPALYWPKGILDLTCIMDMILSFFTGYYSTKKGRVVMNPKKVARRYILTYFVVDLVSSMVPFILIHLLRDARRSFEMCYFIKFLRFFTWMQYLDKAGIRCGYSSYAMKAIKIVIVTTVVVFWSGSIIFLGTDRNFESWLHQSHPSTAAGYINIIAYGVMKATFLLVGIGYGYRTTDTFWESLFAILFMYIGFICKLFVYSQIMQICGKYMSVNNNHLRVSTQLNAYMNYKGLPSNLKYRINQVFEFRFQRKYYIESEILTTVTPILRQEILSHTRRELIRNAQIFKTLPENLISELVAHLKSDVYLPNDVVIKSGTASNFMYFIHIGIAAVYTTSGKEICHLEEGTQFGEVFLIVKKESEASVVAVTLCEIFKLSKSDYLRIIEPYPNLKKEISDIVLEKVHSTDSQFQWIQKPQSQEFKTDEENNN